MTVPNLEQIRFRYILKPAWECCQLGKYDQAAYERIQTGAEYTEEMFEKEIILKNTYKT